MEAHDRRGTDRTWAVIDAVQKIAEDRGVSKLETNLRAARLHLTAAETATLDNASDPHPTDYPYGELAVEQRARTLPAGH